MGGKMISVLICCFSIGEFDAGFVFGFWLSAPGLPLRDLEDFMLTRSLVAHGMAWTWIVSRGSFPHH